MSNPESESLPVVGSYSSQRLIWKRAFRFGWVGGLSGGWNDEEAPLEHFCGHRSERGAEKR